MSVNDVAEPTDTAVHTLARRNSIQRRCSSRAINQNDT